MGLFNFFKKSSSENYSLDISCANAIVILTEHISAYNDKVLDLPYLEKKIQFGYGFLNEGFPHLFEDSSLRHISQNIDKKTNNYKLKMLVDSINAIKKYSDDGARLVLNLDDSPKNLFYEFLFVVHTIFMASKHSEDRFSEIQMIILDNIEKVYNHNKSHNDQIVFWHTGGILIVVQKGQVSQDKLNEIFSDNEKYKNNN